MKIYTRTGDDGTTGLYGGDRVSKTDLRVEAYGTIDEANAVIGLARTGDLPEFLDGWLARAQGELFTVGAELACAPGKEGNLRMPRVGAEHVERLENEIDQAEEGVAALKTFILPGGSKAAAHLHLARCVCRRAERRMLEASAEGELRAELIQYINRLSDWLFALARRANVHAGVEDVPWKSS